LHIFSWSSLLCGFKALLGPVLDITLEHPVFKVLLFQSRFGDVTEVKGS